MLLVSRQGIRRPGERRGAEGDFRAEYVKKANRPKGRDAKPRGLKPRGHDSPVASISTLEKGEMK